MTLAPTPSTIANLPNGITPLNGSEYVPLTQNGLTVKIPAGGFGVTGPQGPQGNTGPAGPQGPQGSPGPGNINAGTAGQLGFYASDGQGLSPLSLGTNLSISGATLNASGAMVLLHSGNGTNTNSSATDLNEFSISGLTSSDTLFAVVCTSSATQNTAACFLRNTTDSVNIISCSGGNQVPATTAIFNYIYIRNTPLSQVDVKSYSLANNVTTLAASATFSTNWTATWSMALRSGAVTSGGTMSYNWAVYKIAGE